MSNQSYECVFHGDRLRFDQLEKELRQTKWIPRGYSHRLASAICSCRKHVGKQPIISYYIVTNCTNVSFKKSFWWLSLGSKPVPGPNRVYDLCVFL